MSYGKYAKIPIQDKLILTPKEASLLSGIGINRMEAILKQKDCPFRIMKGQHTCVKRKVFEEYLSTTNEV